jgi:CheY-like chemotaxis protein
LEAQPARILCVDDEANIRELLRVQLAKVGYEVQLATNGEEAIDAARRDQPDLILLDLHMPFMDGYEASRTLKSDVATADIPIVIISGAGNPTERVQALDIGVDDFIQKPFDRSELLARVRSLLRLRRLHSSLLDSNQELQAAFDAARDAESRYRSLVGDALDAVFVVDRQSGRVREANAAAAALVGCESIDLLSKSFRGICPDAPVDTDDGVETEIVSESGSLISVFIKLSRVKSLREDLLQYTVRDLRPMEMLAQQRMEAERLSAIVETAVTINEEVNTPLSVIINDAEAVRKSLMDQESKVYTRLDRIVTSAKRIQSVVSKLAHVQRAASKEYLPGTQMLDLDSAVSATEKGSIIVSD